MSDERKILAIGNGASTNRARSLLALSAALSVGSPYLNDFLPSFLFKPAPAKQFSNCPICGKVRVNIYNRNGTWKCLKCWNSEAPQ